MSNLKPYVPFLLLILADSLLLAPVPPGLRYAAALGLLAFLPGWVWLQPWLVGPINQVERAGLAVGLSLALTIFGTMLAVYLPGPLALPQILLVMNGLALPALGLAWRQGRSGARLPVPSRHLLLAAAALLVVAALLRLPRLGYAEFHEDEAEALTLGVRLLQGEDYALFLHRKGPAQVLVPLAFWLLGGQINESLARLPFALSSIFSSLTLAWLGWRWFNWRAGLLAGLLWAINGYAIAFGRMVQYQALIFFLGPLAIACLYLASQTPRRAARLTLQLTAAILLAACLLAHYDALLLLPAAGYLWWKIGGLEGWKAGGRTAPSVERGAEAILPTSNLLLPQPPSLIQNSKLIIQNSLPPVLLFLALLASFYVPYLLDPEFQHTAAYLADSRVKPGLLYNNLAVLSRLDGTYSSRFYLPLLALGLAGWAVGRSLALGKAGRWLSAGLGVLVISTLAFPGLWRVGPASLALLPWLLLGLLYFWTEPRLEARAAWLLAGAAFIGYTFLVDDPRTHLYILYPGAVLLAGAGWGAGMPGTKGVEREANQRVSESVNAGRYSFNLQSPRFAAILYPLSSILLFAPLALVVVIYTSLIFLSTESFLTRQREAGWAAVYGNLPKERAYFGYPKREGWKAIGVLRAEGLFPGDFRSINEDFVLPIWYNYGQARSCYDTPAYFFVRLAGEPQAGADRLAGYREVAQVQREGEVRLHIFAAGDKPAGPPMTYALEEYEARFDQLATPAQFIRQAQPAQPVDVRFGPAIHFAGYDLPAERVAPGGVLTLNLYWDALQNPGDNYRAFVHLTDGAAIWGQQDDDPVCRLPTTIWRAGQHGQGQFRLTIKPEAPPGRYPLIIGLYRADTLERLKITGGTAGKLGDDFLWLRDIEIGPAP